MVEGIFFDRRTRCCVLQRQASERIAIQNRERMRKVVALVGRVFSPLDNSPLGLFKLREGRVASHFRVDFREIDAIH